MHSCLMLARCIRCVECGKACGYAADISCRRNMDERQRKQQKREICVSNTGITDAATMNGSYQSPKRLLFAITLVFALPVFSPAQVTVLTSGGFLAAYQELLPQFEKSTGITVTTKRGASQGDGPTTIRAQLRNGLPADVVIMSREGLAELFAEDRITLGSDGDLPRVRL